MNPFRLWALSVPLALSFLGAQAAAADQAPACEAALPSGLSAWNASRPAEGGGELAPGRSYDIVLAPLADIPLTGLDAKELPESGRGAIFTFVAPRPGIYRVAVGDPMWIDLIGPKGVVESSAHGHGPDCSGIAKIVDFPLEAGQVRLELSGAETDASRVMIAPPAD